MILLMLLSLMAVDIDSVFITGIYEDSYIMHKNGEIYCRISINDQLSLIVVFPRPAHEDWLRWSPDKSIFVIIQGHHEYRKMGGRKRLIIFADKIKWILKN